VDEKRKVARSFFGSSGATGRNRRSRIQKRKPKGKGKFHASSNGRAAIAVELGHWGDVNACFGRGECGGDSRKEKIDHSGTLGYYPRNQGREGYTTFQMTRNGNRGKSVVEGGTVGVKKRWGGVEGGGGPRGTNVL